MEHEGEDHDYIEVAAPVMPLPSHLILPLYRYLLEANMGLSGAAFGVQEGYVWAHMVRPLDGLDEVEVRYMIESAVRHVALELPVLVEQFPVGVVAPGKP